MARYGYVRVSTKGQNTARQDVLMRELNVDRVFIDKCSGKNTERPQFQEMMDCLKEGDTVVVESYSRLSRSTTDLLNIVEELNEMGVFFISKKENIDTTTAAGRMFMTFIAGMNQFEREVMLERQREGIEAMPVDENGRKVSAKTGRGFGRPRIEIPESFPEYLRRHEAGEISIAAACKEMGITRPNWYRWAGAN